MLALQMLGLQVSHRDEPAYWHTVDNTESLRSRFVTFARMCFPGLGLNIEVTEQSVSFHRNICVNLLR